MVKYLITGGAGFIGSRLVRELERSAGSEVSVVDNLSSRLPMPQLASPDRAHKADIRERSVILDIVKRERPDVVIHLAAIHHIPTCERERGTALDVNVVGTETVLEACELAGVGRFVLASSGAVYDWAEGPLVEDVTALFPRDNYALSKSTNEHQARFWGERTGADVRIARIFNTIGSRDPNAHLIPDILSQIKGGAARQTVKLGNIGARRDYIHAEDTARAIACLARDSVTGSERVFNVGTGHSVSVLDLVNLIGAAAGIELQVEVEGSRLRAVDRPDQLASTTRTREVFGFSPKYTLRDAVDEILKARQFA